MADIEATLSTISKYKARSRSTSKSSHIPLLASCPTGSPHVVLFGDSMLERMITTGRSSNLVSAWPSEAMMDDESLTNPRLVNVLNAGVGGDKVQNMAYRLLGDASQNLPGLASLVANQKSVRLWVVQAGTNNLSPKRGLSDADRDALATMLRCLLKVEGAPGVRSRILLTGLFPRKDVPREKVDEANGKLVSVVRELNGEGTERVVFLPATEEVQLDEHLVDHVHLNLEGYKLWMKRLFPAVIRVLKEVEEGSH
ncbi:hypothetical protein OQA88_3005 [Cercophora sp. LCS_1]